MPLNISTRPLTYPQPGPATDGLIDLAWLRPGDDLITPVPDRPVSPLLTAFLAVVADLADPWWTIGTAYTLAIHDPCTAGDWHRDAGGAQRFVATIPAPDQHGDVTHQFAQDPYPIPPGVVTAFRNDLHRRPAAPEGWRIFCSAAIYTPDRQPDLTCPHLAPLRTTNYAQEAPRG